MITDYLALLGIAVNSKTGEACQIVGGRPEPDCIFKVDLERNATGFQYGSLMYSPQHARVKIQIFYTTFDYSRIIFPCNVRLIP